MSVIASPKSLATRGRLIQIEGGSNLIPAILLEADTRGILAANSGKSERTIHSINESRKMQIGLYKVNLNSEKREMRYVG